MKIQELQPILNKKWAHGRCLDGRWDREREFIVGCDFDDNQYIINCPIGVITPIIILQNWACDCYNMYNKVSTTKQHILEVCNIGS